MRKFIETPIHLNTYYGDEAFKEKVEQIRANMVLSNGNVDTKHYTVDVQVCEPGMLLYLVPKDEEERKKHERYRAFIPFYDILGAVGEQFRHEYFKERKPEDK